MDNNKSISDRKTYLIKEEVKNLEKTNLHSISDFETELSKYSQEFESGIEVITALNSCGLPNDIKKLQ